MKLADERRYIQGMMINFFMPTKIIMSEGCILKNAELWKDYGKKP